MKAGVLALQGAVGPHVAALERVGALAIPVRDTDSLAAVDALVLPGGESTTIAMLLERAGLADPLAERLAGGLPVLGTCAGMILLAAEVLDGRPDQRAFGVIDISVRRNAFGRQVDSFETDLEIAELGAPFRAVFIRAPVVERTGAGVEVLATVDNYPVLCRQGKVLVSAFHPELSGDDRLHAAFLRLASSG
ncbi:MAG: pyridoxal 5'-phosphate synthase glutaminase subunit PdxT [Acidimicrobiales bacterium]|nr:pyridoxal 5'-phosphate synthase glutaminase subunit PdxT [Acidimicrobiales bacterium]